MKMTPASFGLEGVISGRCCYHLIQYLPDGGREEAACISGISQVSWKHSSLSLASVDAACQQGTTPCGRRAGTEQSNAVGSPVVDEMNRGLFFGEGIVDAFCRGAKRNEGHTVRRS